MTNLLLPAYVLGSLLVALLGILGFATAAHVGFVALVVSGLALVVVGIASALLSEEW